MKKKLFLFAVLMFFCSVSFASDCENSKNMHTSSDCECKKECEKRLEKNSCNEKDSCKEDQERYDKFEIDDDEYFTYNQCFFDKRYRNMKRNLCLTRRQENCIDSVYKNFKADMENLYCKYRNQRDNFLRTIECNNKDCFEYKKGLKELKKEAKEKYKDFREEIEEHLCKNQKSDFRKYQRKEKRKFKKIAKYSKVYKFPCINCCVK